ncbi:MAG: lysophospholipase [Proteobacteria bacterium]|nr:lysophospholipase [Pseudomonadota bacterium]MBU1387008.1 lysophospholipase [Pseudomonadota bacterium]MBU1542311.1 lysophospholipase [Pseudomonadota bacterium]MBU2430546.1 lysophospholipase [Pseudomonadota bacterium]MBU2483028.1 lysophospholipase [Pseudomonadota bacterium]
MTKIALLIFTFLLISAAIYLSIAGFLVISDQQKEPNQEKKRLAFDELLIDYKGLPQLKTFSARDGNQLSYRFYPAQSEKVLVLLHGSGWHSRYLLPLAEFISSANLAKVYTPDLRGHGHTPAKRGDIHYIDQLVDDLADFIAQVKKENPDSLLIIGGHSSGGGLSLRFAESKYGQQADAYILLSPWLQYNAPTIRPDENRWATPYTRRIIGLSMLNNVGINWFNYLPVIKFDMPKEMRDGTETLSYSYRLNTGYAPRDYKKALSSIKQPMLVVVGTNDQLFFAEKFEPVISQYAEAEVRLVDGLTHMGVVVNPAVQPIVKKWLESIDRQPSVPV